MAEGEDAGGFSSPAAERARGADLGAGCGEQADLEQELGPIAGDVCSGPCCCMGKRWVPFEPEEAEEGMWVDFTCGLWERAASNFPLPRLPSSLYFQRRTWPEAGPSGPGVRMESYCG